MSVNLTIANSRGRLDPAIVTAIQSGLDGAVSAISDHVEVRNIDVIVQLHEWDVYGRAYGPESFTIYVNPSDPKLREWDGERFKHLCIHELNHVLRWRHLRLDTFADWTPGEVLVLEGLATQCEMFLGCPSYPQLEIQSELLDPLLKRIAPHISSKYADTDWFDEPCDLPNGTRRAAGPMGHLLVGRFLERSGQTALTALDVPWRQVWDMGHLPGNAVSR